MSRATLTLAFVATAATETTLSSMYETTVDHHISELMPLFLNADLNSEWNPRLSRQQLIRTKEFGEIVHQEYSLPWPLAPRHMLMKCSRDVRPKASTFKSSCHSVEHDSIPLSRDAVRVHLSSTSWEIRALPNEQTHIRLRLELPEQMATGVPSFVVNYAQDSSLRDSVNAFMSTVRRLKLPPSAEYASWGRPHGVERASGWSDGASASSMGLIELFSRVASALVAVYECLANFFSSARKLFGWGHIVELWGWGQVAGASLATAMAIAIAIAQGAALALLCASGIIMAQRRKDSRYNIRKVRSEIWSVAGGGFSPSLRSSVNGARSYLNLLHFDDW